MATHTGAEQPRRRFAPVAIETTFTRVRKNGGGEGPGGPVAEPTPSPSPQSGSPPLLSSALTAQFVTPPQARGRKERPRRAPQLVESSVRRSRRAGDEGPATKPSDRTDITPYTNHIYAPKARRRHGQSRSDEERRAALARRESQDDEIAGPVFDLSAREARRAQKEIEEVALAAFPNYGNRIGGAVHYFVREGSGSDHESDDAPSPTRGRTIDRGFGRHRPSRRNSSAEDISWAYKEMQEHASKLDQVQEEQRLPSLLPDRVSTLDLDNMHYESPPNDGMFLTRLQRRSITGSPSYNRRLSTLLQPIGETVMPYIPPEPVPKYNNYYKPDSAREAHSPPPLRPIGESYMPYIPSAPEGKAADMAYAPASQIPPDTSFHHAPAGPYGGFSPFGGFSPARDPSLERLRNMHKVKNNSPPMLGSDIEFRRCPSPKFTKMEPDHLWDLERGAMAEERNRDVSGEKGLWRGYCYSDDQSQQLATVHRPAMISTPMPETVSGDPFERAFSMSALNDAMSGELEAETTAAMPRLHPQSAKNTMYPGHLARKEERKGLRMLQGLDERLAKEKEAAELEERITAEFDDHFVTQVYNYLSLGYPAMARSYDEELSKISKEPVEQLRKDDDAIMDHLWGIEPAETDEAVEMDGSHTSGASSPRKKAKVTGHIMLDSEEHDGVREEDRCPRWKALKKYIYEWARQHPDLDAISPLAWGMQERRGSWGI